MAFRLFSGSAGMKWVLGAVLAALVAGGLYTGFNTNVFGPDRLCGGWLKSSDVERVLDGPGRLSDSGTNTVCTVKKSGLLVGGDASITVRIAAEPVKFPFMAGSWTASAAQQLFAGQVGGGADGHGGWVLLPASCRIPAGVPSDKSDAKAAVVASVAGGSTGEGALVRLLSAAAESVAARSGCAAEGRPTELASARTSSADFARVCALPGFSIPSVTGDKGRAGRAQVTGDLGTAWICDLSFAGDKQGPYARFAAVRDPLLAQGLSTSGATRLDCPGGPVYATVDNNTYPWDPAERRAAGLLPEKDLRDRFAAAVADALHCPAARGT